MFYKMLYIYKFTKLKQNYHVNKGMSLEMFDLVLRKNKMTTVATVWHISSFFLTFYLSGSVIARALNFLSGESCYDMYEINTLLHAFSSMSQWKATVSYIKVSMQFYLPLCLCVLLCTKTISHRIANLRSFHTGADPIPTQRRGRIWIDFISTLQTICPDF